MNSETSADMVRRKAEETHDIVNRAEAKRRQDMLTKAAFQIGFSRVAYWTYKLDITRRQREIVGTVLSFQATGAECRMSLATFAALLGIDRQNVKKELSHLVDCGYLTKKSNGPRKPASYSVNAATCMEAAIANGFVLPEGLDL